MTAFRFLPSGAGQARAPRVSGKRPALKAAGTPSHRSIRYAFTSGASVSGAADTGLPGRR